MNNFNQQQTNPYGQAWGGGGGYQQWLATPSFTPNRMMDSNPRNYNNAAYNNGGAFERRSYSTSSHPGQQSQQSNNNHQQQPTRPNPRPPRNNKKPAPPADRDAILPPSARSGGVPSPTPSYLLRASFLPQTLQNPRPILVVIDLNGTMLFRPNRKQPFNFVERPHARRFLNYCIETFTVAIWSSARPENVEKMCSQLLTPQQLDAVVATWGRNKFGLTLADYNARTMCYKRLDKLWADPKVAASHPLGEAWNQGNTVLIDDTAEKARSEPHNAITLPEFMGDVNEPPVLPSVHEYLNTLALQVDISTYIRTNPFKLGHETDAIGAPENAIVPAMGATGIYTET